MLITATAAAIVKDKATTTGSCWPAVHLVNMIHISKHHTITMKFNNLAFMGK